MHSFPYTCLLLVVFAMMPGTAGAADGVYLEQRAPDSNAQVIAELTAEALIAGVFASTDSIHPPKELPVFLNIDVPASVRSRLTAALLDAGVRLTSEREGRHVISVEWKTHNRLVAHRRSSSRRELSGTIFVSWIDASTEIRNTWELAFEYSDVVQTGDAVELQDIGSGGWEPARFHSQESSARRRFLRRVGEPALVTGAVAVTIYLLYNVRR